MSPALSNSLVTLDDIERLQLNDDPVTAQQYCEQLLASSNLSIVEKKRAHNLMARILIDLQQYAQAIDHLQASQQCQRTSNDSEKNNDDLATFHQNMAHCFHKLMNWQTAIDHYQQAIHYLRLCNATQSLALTHNNLGHAYQQLEQFESALHSYQAAIETNAFAEKPYETAVLYNNIGLLYTKTGNHDKELYYYQKAESILSTLDYPSLFASIYNNIGLSYTRQNKYTLALNYLQKSLQIRQNLHGENHALVANLYNNIGHCYLTQGKGKDALGYFQKSIAIRQHLNEKDSPFYANAIHNMGIILMHQKQSDTAKQHFEEALSMRQAIFPPHHPEIATSYLQLAEYFNSIDDYATAHHYADQAFQIFSGSVSDDLDSLSVLNSPEPARLLHILLLKSQLFIDQNPQNIASQESLITAYRYAQTAVLLTDELRKGYRSDGSKLVLASKGIAALEKSLQICLLLHLQTQNEAYLAEAFTYSEKSKAVLLLDAIKDAEAKLLSEVDPDLLQKEKYLQQQLFQLDQNILMERSKATPDVEKIHKYQATHFDLYNEYETLLSHIEISHPDYHYLKYNIATISIESVQHCLQKCAPKAAMVSYMLTNEQLYIFVITHQSYKVITTSLNVPIGGLVEDFMAAINFLNHEDFVELGYSLYQILLEPALTEISQHVESLQELIIIPDGELNYLPFEALLTAVVEGDTPYAKLPYLLHQCDICYHYSATLLYETMMRPRPPQANSFCGFAPVYAYEKTDTPHSPTTPTSPVSRKASVDGKNYGELQHSVIELEKIAQLFDTQAAPVQLYLYQNASEDNFKQYSPNYKYLHIAAHGILNKQHPELSGILLYDKHATDAHKMLYIAETYHLNLNADLVVLSCCESGIGKMVRGEGMMAINRGFLYAGAKNIIYTLFKVYDQESAQLTERLFHEILLHQHPYHRALGLAKKHLIAQTNVPPKAWAGFVLLGY
jgi:CHAT domain-containing protein